VGCRSFAQREYPIDHRRDFPFARNSNAELLVAPAGSPDAHNIQFTENESETAYLEIEALLIDRNAEYRYCATQSNAACRKRQNCEPPTQSQAASAPNPPVNSLTCCGIA